MPGLMPTNSTRTPGAIRSFKGRIYSKFSTPDADAMTAPPIRVDNVSKRFEKTVALDGVSLEVHAGEIFGLLGPNGAGKTTLIRAILDLIKPDSGHIEIFGHLFAPADRNRIGYLPEERGLYPRQKIGAVLEYLGALKGLSPADARAAASHWLARLELSEAADMKVEQLSKSRCRVSIRSARASSRALFATALTKAKRCCCRRIRWAPSRRCARACS